MEHEPTDITYVEYKPASERVRINAEGEAVIVCTENAITYRFENSDGIVMFLSVEVKSGIKDYEEIPKSRLSLCLEDV